MPYQEQIKAALWWGYYGIRNLCRNEGSS